MNAQGLLYCPWREQYVTPPRPVAPNTLTIEDWKACFSLRCVKSDISALRPWQANFLKEWFGTEESFALQADPGEGKTRAALLAADRCISAGGRAVIVVQTKDHLQQMRQEVGLLFNAPDGSPIDPLVATLSGKDGPEGRQRAYDDPRKRLIIVTAACFARDFAGVVKKTVAGVETSAPKVALTSRDLLVLDEGDLMRGDESLARVHRQWKALGSKKDLQGNPAPLERPRLLIQSATLLITYNPDPDHWEVREYEKAHDVGRFFNVPAPASLNYDVVDPDVGRLPRGVCTASQSIRAHFWELIERIEYTELDVSADPESAVQRCIQKLKKGKVREPDYYDKEGADSQRHSHTLPSVKLMKSLVSALVAREKLARGSSSLEPLRYCLRDAYQAFTLFHCNNLLTNELRVSFLQYAGTRIHEVRTGLTTTPHLRELFPPGALPSWWNEMARSTPYERLPGPADAGVFFGNQRVLGTAAQELLSCSLYDHPNLRNTLAWLNGSIRQRGIARGGTEQAMVVCGTAVETMYLRDKIRKECGESTVTLMGHSHLSSTQRSGNFALAHAGAASIVTATSVAERGVDLQNLKNLLILNPPYDLRQAKQLLGRVGRNVDLRGLVVFLYAEGTGREIMLRALAAKSARYGDDSPLKKLFQDHLPGPHRRRKRKGPHGPGLFG